MNEKNRWAKKRRWPWIIGSIFLLIDDPAPQTDRHLPFTLTLVTNENLESTQLVAHRKAPLSNDASETEHLNLAWPTGVISLSHVALPFPPDDPLYGQRPPIDE